MVIPNETAGDVQQQLHVHPFGEVWTLTRLCISLRLRLSLEIEAMIVGQARRQGRIRALETGEQSIAESCTRRFADESWLGRSFMNWFFLLPVEEWIEQIALFCWQCRHIVATGVAVSGAVHRRPDRWRWSLRGQCSQSFAICFKSLQIAGCNQSTDVVTRT